MAVRSNKLSSRIRSPVMCARPRARNWRNSSQKRSITSQGSPPPLRMRSPCKVLPLIVPSTSTCVCQRWSAPSRSSAAAVVTSFMTEAGLRGVLTLWAMVGPVSPTRLMKTLTESGATLFISSNCATCAGNSAAASRQATRPRSAIPVAINRTALTQPILNRCSGLDLNGATPCLKFEVSAGCYNVPRPRSGRHL